MNSVSERFWLVCGCVGLLATTVMAQQTPTLSLKAVRLNPTCIGGGNAGADCSRNSDCSSGDCGGDLGTCLGGDNAGLSCAEGSDCPGGSCALPNTVSAASGDVIAAEIFASEWSPSGQQLRAWQVLMPRAAASSGTRGTALPPDVPCATDADCLMNFQECALVQVCTGAFIDTSRPDWVFAGQSSGGGVAPTLIRYAHTLFPPLNPQPYTPPPKYCGTLVLVVSDDACGTFTFPILGPDQDCLAVTEGETDGICNLATGVCEGGEFDGAPCELDSFLVDENSQFIPGLVTEDLTLTVTSPDAAPGECSCLNIVASDTPNCTIDARQPTDPDGTNPQSYSFTLTFDCNDTSTIIANDFDPFEVPAGFVDPIVDTLTTDPIDRSNLTVTLAGAFRTKKWTCLRFIPGPPGANEVCLGLLPGDVDESSLSNEADVTAMIDCLNTPGLCTDFQCDIDRSSTCTGADILREIDLLNGAAAFVAWFNEAIEPNFGGNPIPCPSSPPP